MWSATIWSRWLRRFISGWEVLARAPADIRAFAPLVIAEFRVFQSPAMVFRVASSWAVSPAWVRTRERA
jgi:hypothetical protein